MAATVGNYYIMNQSILPMDTYDQYYVDRHPAVYEVIRVIEGKPLFAEEHFQRMVLSAASVGCMLDMTLEMLCRDIRNLSVKCALPNMNVRVVINNFSGENNYDYYLTFVPTHYPSAQQYAQGVPTALLHAVRSNPHAKIVNQSLRDQADRMIREQGLHEVILTNDAGEITEGSRSNIFFLRDGELYTSPSDGVLLGVTRMRIMKVCEDNAIPVHEVRILASEVDQFEAAFISGTSPNILPIRRVGDVEMNVQEPCLRKLMGLFDEIIRKSLESA